MTKPNLRQISSALAFGLVSLVLAHCSSSSGSTGGGDGGVHLTTGPATTGAGGGSATTTVGTTATTGATTTSSTTGLPPPVGSGGSGTGGSGTGGSGGGGMGACAPMQGDDACAMCLKGKCCNELSACDADVECVNLLVCAGNCQDQTCVNNCAMQYPNGLNAAQPFVQCAQTNCSTECM